MGDWHPHSLTTGLVHFFKIKQHFPTIMRLEPEAQHILSTFPTSAWLVTLLPDLWAPPQPVFINITCSNILIYH